MRKRSPITPNSQRNPLTRWSSIPATAFLCIASAEIVGHLIDAATQFHHAFPQTISLIPLAALLVLLIDSHDRLRIPTLATLIHSDGRLSHQSRSRKWGPLLVFLVSVFISHAIGASVGREGVVLLFSLFVFLAMRHQRPTTPDEIATLIGCAFAAATSNVVAGALLATETGDLKRQTLLRTAAIYACFVLIWLAFGRPFPFFQPTVRPTTTLGWSELPRYGIAVALGFIAGGVSFAFHLVVKQIRNRIQNTQRPRIWIFSIATCLMILLASPWGESSQGLGIEGIRRFFSQAALIYEPFLKTLATALSIGVGLKGGEYTPLLWIGSSLGSLLESVSFGFSAPQLAALGFGGIFAHASRCPLTSVALVVGLGGWATLPFALVICVISHSLGGTDSLYLIPHSDRWRIKRYFL